MVRLNEMINHMFILNLPPGSVWEVFWPKRNCYGPSLQHEYGELMADEDVVKYTWVLCNG